MRLLFVLYTLCIFLLSVSDRIWILKKNYVYIKTTASFGFLVIAAYSAVISGNTVYYLAVLPGLLFCFMGDLFLGIRYSKYYKQLFAAGALSFLLGHLTFIHMLGKVEGIHWYELLFPLFMTVEGVIITKLPGMKMMGSRVLVLIYDFIISLLLSRAVFTLFYTGITMRNSLFLAGIFLFWISDFILLFVIFYEKKYRNLKTLNFITYYYGMFLIALSVLYRG